MTHDTRPTRLRALGFLLLVLALCWLGIEAAMVRRAEPGPRRAWARMSAAPAASAPAPSQCSPATLPPRIRLIPACTVVRIPAPAAALARMHGSRGRTPRLPRAPPYLA